MTGLTRADEIARSLRDQMRSGTYRRGGRIPAERELAERYDASRETIRRALEILDAEGLIERKGPAGTFVAGQVASAQPPGRVETPPRFLWLLDAAELAQAQSFLHQLARVASGLIPLDKDPLAMIPANDEVAEQLEIPPRTLVMRRFRYLFARDADYTYISTTYHLIESFYPGDLFAHLFNEVYPEAVYDSVALVEMLATSTGRQPAHLSEHLRARLPKERERQLLKITHAAPVFEIDVQVRDRERRVLEFARIVTPAARFSLDHEAEIE